MAFSPPAKRICLRRNTFYAYDSCALTGSRGAFFRETTIDLEIWDDEYPERLDTVVFALSHPLCKVRNLRIVWTSKFDDGTPCYDMFFQILRTKCRSLCDVQLESSEVHVDFNVDNIRTKTFFDCIFSKDISFLRISAPWSELLFSPDEDANEQLFDMMVCGKQEAGQEQEHGVLVPAGTYNQLRVLELGPRSSDYWWSLWLDDTGRSILRFYCNFLLYLVRDKLPNLRSFGRSLDWVIGRRMDWVLQERTTMWEEIGLWQERNQVGRALLDSTLMEERGVPPLGLWPIVLGKAATSESVLHTNVTGPSPEPERPPIDGIYYLVQGLVTGPLAGHLAETTIKPNLALRKQQEFMRKWLGR